MLALVWVAIACDSSSDQQPDQVIHLDELTQLPEHKMQVADDFRVAVAAILSPQGNVSS